MSMLYIENAILILLAVVKNGSQAYLDFIEWLLLQIPFTPKSVVQNLIQPGFT